MPPVSDSMENMINERYEGAGGDGDRLRACAEDDAGRGAGEARWADGPALLEEPGRAGRDSRVQRPDGGGVSPPGGRIGQGEWVDAVSRRGFLKVMGASLALAGLAGCTKQPDEEIYPYIRQPEDLVLGKPMYFATAHPFPTGAIPVLVKSDAFRPIKIEGNPDHPMSKGKSDATTQGTLLDLYDPDRSHGVFYRGRRRLRPLPGCVRAAIKKTQGGQGVYFLSETITSPTLAAQWKAVQAAYPNAKMVQWEPINRDSAMTASKAAFGSYTDAQYKLENADVILSLDADFLGGIQHPGFLPMAAAYAERHRFDAEEPDKPMNRMYVVESMPTVTGFKAEHRLALKPSEIAGFAAGASRGWPAASSNPRRQSSWRRCLRISRPLAASAS